MKTFKKLTLILLVVISSTTIFGQQNFNKSKDFLLANFDLKPDEDDLMAAAAFGSMLLHDDLQGVNYFTIAGAYGTQDCEFIETAVPGFYNNLFGTENVNWTNAHNNWSASVDRAKVKVKAALDAGGRVFVAEAGQSDITYDILQAVMDDGVALSKIQEKVIVVQHSEWNENKTTQWKLDWIKENTNYNKIDDGNNSGNNTPQYKDNNTTWMNQARSSSNPNPTAGSYWTESFEIADEWTACYENGAIAGGGVDFSDNVEMWFIFDIGDKANTISKFWERYVVNDANSDEIISVSNPTSITRGSTATLTVDYSASSNRDIVVYFQLAQSPWTTYSQVTKNVSAGSGTLTIDIAIPTSTPVSSEAYQFQTIITTDGGDWGDRLDNLSKSGVSIVDAPSDVQSAYPSGEPHAIPGTISSINYDNGGEGVAYHDASAGNAGAGPRQDEDVDLGSNNIGWISTGEWVEYTVDVEAGTYDVAVEVASATAYGKFHIEFNDTDKTGVQTVNNTGGWATYYTITIPDVNLSGGQQVMRVYMDGKSFNLKNMTFTKQVSSSEGPEGYTYSCDENQTVVVTGSMNIAYGANDSYYYLYNQSSNVTCNNATFGDPISGVVKKCYVQTASTSGSTGCNFQPMTSALPTINTSYSNIFVTGTGPNLDDINKFSINWNLTNNGLYTFAFNTKSGVPSYYVDMKNKVSQTLNNSQPSISVSGSGITGFDGDYYAIMDGDNFVLAEQSGAYSIYFSNSSTAPSCDDFKSTEGFTTNEFSEVLIYPNPVTNNYINIEGLEEADFQVVVTDMLGKTMLIETVNSNSNSIDIRKLKSGTYILNIKGQGGEISRLFNKL